MEKTRKKRGKKETIFTTNQADKLEKNAHKKCRTNTHTKNIIMKIVKSVKECDGQVRV